MNDKQIKALRSFLGIDEEEAYFDKLQAEYKKRGKQD